MTDTVSISNKSFEEPQNGFQSLEEKYEALKLKYEKELAERKSPSELAISEMRYRRLFESAKDGILMLDAENALVTDVNPFLIQRLDATREQFLGKYVDQIGFFKYAFPDRKTFHQLFTSGYWRSDCLYLEGNNCKKIEVEIIGNVYLENTTRTIQLNIRDITERRLAQIELIRAKEKAEENDRLKTAFLQNMNHEIRKPMNAIISFSDLLNENFDNPTKIKKFAKIVKMQSHDLLSIVNDVLDIATIEVGADAN
jgi:PAS domain S-box-containing protein